MDMQVWATGHAIHTIWAGSRLYGTARPDSDWDLRGVCLMPPRALIGLLSFEQYQKHDETEDTTIYGLTRFFALAIEANPNILDLLCAPPETWLTPTPEWHRVYERRHLFLSQKLRDTFSGYALDQLRRLQHHYRWRAHPPGNRAKSRRAVLALPILPVIVSRFFTSRPPPATEQRVEE